MSGGRPLECIYCGCTEEQGCPIAPDSCWWYSQDPDICSGCHEIATVLGRGLTPPRPAADGFAILDWLCVDKKGPRVVLDRWHRIAVAETAKARAREAKRGRRKTPAAPAPATSRKVSIPVSHKSPRRIGRVSRQPGGRR